MPVGKEASRVALGMSFGVTLPFAAPRLRTPRDPTPLGGCGLVPRSWVGGAFRKVAPKNVPRATRDASFPTGIGCGGERSEWEGGGDAAGTRPTKRFGRTMQLSMFAGPALATRTTSLDSSSH